VIRWDGARPPVAESGRIVLDGFNPFCAAGITASACTTDCVGTLTVWPTTPAGVSKCEGAAGTEFAGAGCGAGGSATLVGEGDGTTTGTDGGESGTATSAVPTPLADGACESAADTALCAGAGTTAASWLSAADPGPAAFAPVGTITASVNSAVTSAPDKPQNFAIR
jgi:hypothetical protein